MIDLIKNVANVLWWLRELREEEEIPWLKDMAEEYRKGYDRAIAETDEELMMKYLEGEEITEEELHCIRKATIANEIYPCFVIHL